MPEYSPKTPAPEYALPKLADALDVPITRRDFLDVLGKIAEHSGDPIVRRICGEVWDEYTVTWRHGPPQQPTT